MLICRADDDDDDDDELVASYFGCYANQFALPLFLSPSLSLPDVAICLLPVVVFASQNETSCRRRRHLACSLVSLISHLS